MFRSYKFPDPSEKVQEIAKKVTELLVDSSMTYREAEEALSLARAYLQDTKPVSV